jgi:hypothetical protein
VSTEQHATPPPCVALKIAMRMPMRVGLQCNQQADAILLAIEL